MTDEFDRMPPKTHWAEVAWTVADVRDFVTENEQPDNLGNLDDRIEDWLFDNEKYIRDAMVERGWQAISDLLTQDPL